MVKLICLDMDGTLLNSKLQISEGNREAIHEAMRNGIHVTLATGRMYASALTFARELGIDIPIITMNGALIKHPVTEAKLQELIIEKERLESVIRILEAEVIRPNFYNEYTLYVGEGLERYQRMMAQAAVDSRYAFRVIDEQFTYQDLLAEAGNTIQKGILFPPVQRLEEIRTKLKAIGGLSVVSSSPFNIELTHYNATKGQAIRTLGESLKIRPGEIMAIGDSENDRSMLEEAGYPVLMGNAAQDLIIERALRTLDNNNDGVAEAIRTYALGEIC